MATSTAVRITQAHSTARVKKNIQLGRELKKVLWADEETLTVGLQFCDGKKIKVNLESIFSKPKGLALEIMKGNLFAQCFIESGALAWPNGLELCPDQIQMMAVA